MKKQLIIFVFLALNFCLFGFSYAQITNFYGTRKIQANGYTGALYRVEISRYGETGHTLVTIELKPTRNLNRLTFNSSNSGTVIRSGNWEAKSLGYLSGEDIYTFPKNCTSYEFFPGWNNVKIGQSYFYTLVFDGAIPPGLTTFSLIDESPICSGFSFTNYDIDNPNNHPTLNLSEDELKEKIDEQNDGVVGIYESFNKGGYKLACIKEGNDYKLVYISAGTYRSWWSVGDIKANLRSSATFGVFKADWYMAAKTLNSDVFVSFDGKGMNVVINGEEDVYLKMYPTSSSNNTLVENKKSTGTGFAISSSGYIVTNYHVIENAKSIEVKGINGNFSKKNSATLILSDERTDLAIIKINEPGFTSLGSVPYTFKQGTADIGENIFVLGYPMTSTMGEDIKVTNGIISSKTGYKGDISTYQISAPVQPGNSGAPLFDKNGNLVGIVNSKHTSAENAGYAIKMSYLKNLIDLLPEKVILPTSNTLNGKPLTEQVKIASNYTYLIIINDK